MTVSSVNNFMIPLEKCLFGNSRDNLQQRTDVARDAIQRVSKGGENFDKEELKGISKSALKQIKAKRLVCRSETAKSVRANRENECNDFNTKQGRDETSSEKFLRLSAEKRRKKEKKKQTKTEQQGKRDYMERLNLIEQSSRVRMPLSPLRPNGKLLPTPAPSLPGTPDSSPEKRGREGSL